MGAPKKDQIDRLERIQDLFLKNLEAGLVAKTLSSTDHAIIYRMLKDNGWNLDPSRVPQGIRDLLTKHVDPTLFDEADPDMPGGH